MTPEQLLQAKELFLEAIDRAPEERRSWLTAQSAIPDVVHEQLLLQLRLYESEPDLLPASDAVLDEADVTGSEDALADPETLGRYRVLRRLGEGGMGIVYACEQPEPVRRQVAVKRLKAGMDSAAIAQRFEAERQALARMSHPYIAQVFDGGVDEVGRPFFAMEFVDGEPITTYADTNQLTLEVRLRLFLALCRGIAHAHRRGVLHRDIKPANTLVTEVDGVPTPKIIDFGIAKAIGESFGAETLHTQHGAVLGTPDYMSPEQATQGGADLDTRSDVYSLGVVLYELLTGQLPRFGDDQRGSRRGSGSSTSATSQFGAEPVRPSSRFRKTSADTGQLAAARGAPPAVLHRKLRHDLDWVVLRALRTDREERYESVSALARDVEHYLAHEPVEAGPPSLAYRLRRGLRRHRVAVIGAAAIATSLLVGGGFAVLYAIDADRLRKVAEAQVDRAYDTLSRSYNRARFLGRPDADEVRLRQLQDEILARSHPGFVEARVRASDGLYVVGLKRLSDYLLSRLDEFSPVARIVAADILHRYTLANLRLGNPELALHTAEAPLILREAGTPRFDSRPFYSRLLQIDALQASGRHADALVKIERWRPTPGAGVDALVDAQYRARLGAALVVKASSIPSGDARDSVLDEAEKHLSHAQLWLPRHEPGSFGCSVADAATIELYELRGRRDLATESLARLRKAVAQRNWSPRFGRIALGHALGSEAMWTHVSALFSASQGSRGQRATAIRRLNEVIEKFGIIDSDPRWLAVLPLLCNSAKLCAWDTTDASTHAIVELADRLASAHADLSPFSVARTALYVSKSLALRGRLEDSEERARNAVSIPRHLTDDPASHWHLRKQWGQTLVRLERFDEGLEQLIVGFVGIAELRGQLDFFAQSAAGQIATAFAVWHQADRDAAQRALPAMEAELSPDYPMILDVALAWSAAQRFDREEVLERADRVIGKAKLYRRFAERLGEALSRVGEYDQAMECLELALRHAEQQSAGRVAYTLDAIGGIAFRHGRYDRATDAFDRAASKAPQSKWPAEGLQAIDRRSRDESKTTHDGLDLRPSSIRLLFGPRDLFRIGELASSSSDRGQSVAEAFGRTANLGAAWLDYLRALAQHDRLDEARKLTERLLDDPFRGLETWDAVARFYATTDGLSAPDRRRGLKVAREAFERSGRGNSPRIEATLAEAELATGARESAIRRFERLRGELRRKSAEWISAGDIERCLQQIR